ncbi:hypothetical protein Egran_00100 [Elaphomyces granulatus]|uniref:Mediator complex subunit 27 n=1 Tax=Elaphomyces granulatus TaxID=519963 RepID=A0A232M6W5_9EURO|nr:hypothetical protein Egran_00100 [Elaphomyces granulatus]
MSNIPSASAGSSIPIKAARADLPNSTLNEANKKEEGLVEADWSSERQLATSLWRLQELEAKIHQLRTLLPDRLLGPLVPIVSPHASHKKQAASPQILGEQLAQSARGGYAEVELFKLMWQSPEMKVIWDRIDNMLKESNGIYPQPSGMWERDYDVVLEELSAEERKLEERRQKDEELQERLKVLSTDGGWKGVVESFRQRGLPGVQIVLSRNEIFITVVLTKTGMAFDIQGENGQVETGVSEWRVSSKQRPGVLTTKFESSVLNCLNSRPRKWDLAYLLDMMYSYSEIRNAKCKKCDQMIDRTAQLPAVRLPMTLESSDGKKSVIWEPYHHGCI